MIAEKARVHRQTAQPAKMHALQCAVRRLYRNQNCFGGANLPGAGSDFHTLSLPTITGFRQFDTTHTFDVGSGKIRLTDKIKGEKLELIRRRNLLCVGRRHRGHAASQKRPARFVHGG